MKDNHVRVCRMWLLLFGSIIATSFAPGLTHAQTTDTVWTEDFENPLHDAQWSVDAGTWEIGVPTVGVGPTSTHSGTRCAGTNLAGNYANGVNSRLVSPPFSIPSGAVNPRLRFWHWFSFSIADSGYVDVRAVGDSVWHPLGGPYTATSSNAWSSPLLPLSAYTGQTIEIAFRFKSVNASGYSGDFSTGWYIDDMDVVTGALVFNNPENWESGVGDWSVDAGTWEVGVPTSGPDSAHSGIRCAATVLAGNYANGVNSRLVSPPFSIPSGAVNPRLRFWHWFSFSIADSGYVEVRAVGDSVWYPLGGPYTATSSNAWSSPLLPLSAYMGQTVEIAFRFKSVNASGVSGDFSTGWYVDDIQVVWEGLPSIHCPPAPLSLSLCSGDLACVDLQVDNATSVTVGEGATWSGNALCFTPAIAGSYTYRIIASNLSGADTCDLTVNVSIVNPPVISCPSDTVRVTSCGAGQVCVDLPITGPKSVEVAGVAGATWSGGKLCFNADHAGTYLMDVAAAPLIDSCDTARCQVLVKVAIVPPPVVSCPSDTIRVTSCGVGQVCVDLPITNFKRVDVSGITGATWTNGKLCFAADHAGSYSLNVTAYPLLDSCDTVRCEVMVKVGIVSPPVISCPATTIDTTICDSNRICLNLPISNAGQVIVTGANGASWQNGKLCFDALVAGEYSLHVKARPAGGACDSAECVVAVHVTQSSEGRFEPGELLFATTEDAAQPPRPQIVRAISPCGPAGTDWKLTVIDGGDWLNVDRILGTGGDSVIVSIAAQHYTAGVKHALLVFTDAHTSTEFGSVYVTFFIEPGVDVGRDSVTDGRHIKIPIRLYSKKALRGFTIPLKYETQQKGKINLDSLVLDRSVADTAIIIPDSNIVIVTMFRPRQDPPVPESTYVPGTMYFTVAADAQSEIIPINKTSVVYGGQTYSYQFVDTSGTELVPQFNPGAIIIPRPDTTETAFAFPNPFNPARDGHATFVLPQDEHGTPTVSIYDASMVLVTKRTGEMSWDGRNDRGDTVANGVYFYVIETTSGYRGAGKLAVLR